MSPDLEEVTRARSPRAYEKYKALVTTANAVPVRLAMDFDLTEAVATWDELTALEAEVFGIDAALLNALVYGHLRYQEMIGICDVEFDAYRQEERAAFPLCFLGDCVYSMDAAIGFMVEACLLPQTQATAWVARYSIQVNRSGLIENAFTARSWAVAETQDL